MIRFSSIRQVAFGLALAVASLCQAEMHCLRLGGPAKPAQLSNAEGAEGLLKFDMSGLPKNAKVLRADLVIVRSVALSGRDDDANVKIEIVPQGPDKGGAAGAALALRGPWFDRFDATQAVALCAAGKAKGEFLIKTCPKLDAEGSYLDVYLDGKAGAKLPQAASGVKVLHRAGQSFVTWKEVEDPFGQKAPTLGQFRDAADKFDKPQLRYRIYRHDKPITKDTLAAAELLAEVKPLSGWNPAAVSADQVIYTRQIRSIDDGLFARSIADSPFDVSAKSKEFADVPVERLAIEDQKPLPSGTGLYVHNPAKAGEAYYAVLACLDGVANTADIKAGDAATDKPVQEQPGAGAPVYQRPVDLKVFYDYPGQRRLYVQWCAPPLANLPNTPHNWSLYVPPLAQAAPAAGSPATAPAAPELQLGIYFHDWRTTYLRPRWPHLKDQVMLCTLDAPYPSFGYGYHEALGTLKAFREGSVHDYTGARIDAFLEWAQKEFKTQPNAVSCHGMGSLGGTAALHYAMRRPERIALAVFGYFDAQPKSMPATIRSNERQVKTHLAEMEAVWGKRDWECKTAKGVSVWDDRDMVAAVGGAAKTSLPWMSLGGSTGSHTWPSDVALMKALMQARQPFWSEFVWGGSPPLFGPLHARRDRLMIAVAPAESDFMKSDRWTKAAIGYSSGGTINTGVSWRPESVVDTAEKLEVEGSFGGPVTLRNAQQFKLQAGEKVKWTLDTGQRDKPFGEAAADENGVLTIPGLSRGKLSISKE